MVHVGKYNHQTIDPTGKTETCIHYSFKVDMFFGFARSGVHLEMIRKDDIFHEKTVNQYSKQCIRTYLYWTGATCPSSRCFKSNVQCTCICLTGGKRFGTARPHKTQHLRSRHQLFSVSPLLSNAAIWETKSTFRNHYKNYQLKETWWSWFPNKCVRIKQIQWMDLW